jgi:hypothetical protein
MPRVEGIDRLIEPILPPKISMRSLAQSPQSPLLQTALDKARLHIRYENVLGWSAARCAWLIKYGIRRFDRISQAI